MIITCPQCGTKYKLADHRLQPEGSRVRCSSCSFVFHCPPPTEGDSQIKAEQRTNAEASEASPLQPPAPETAKKSRKSLFLLLLLLLVVLSAAAYLYYPQLKAVLPFLGESSSPISLSRKSEEPLPDLSRITFTDVRQYMVNNKNIGQLLVIEGKAINQYQAAVEMIKVQAEIFDANGLGLKSKTFYCGNTLSLFQLQVLDRREMETALGSRVGVLTNNSNLQPDQEVSFMTVFYNPPQEMAEFSLKVIQADPVASN
ncbi:MAG: zinc-ribbon domain-containing protein [Desulfohalobiaceae bacterium]|nr:zinc-ribbon domain-containing protein [Desulfohalobiaceae bacterium]